MGRGEPPARLPELHSHHFPDKGIAWRSRSSSRDTGKGQVRHVWLRHTGCRMAACLCQGWQLSLLPAILLSLRSPPSAPEPVTSQDAALLAGVSEDILCFSRSFEDLTCFWDEEETTTGMCHFYYWYYRDAPTACVLSTWHHGAGGKRHVCVFPSQDVRLFTQLHLRVLDATTNHTKYWRELSVEAVGLIAPPVNITARWAGTVGQLCVSWQPPLADFPNFFLYEVQCCPANSTGMPCSTTLNPSEQHPGDPSTQSTVSTHTPRAASPALGQRLVQANTWVVLQDLQPGVRYHIQVRSKPDGTSMDGVWGPWSQAVAAETPHSSGEQPPPPQGCWQEQQGGTHAGDCRGWGPVVGKVQLPSFGGPRGSSPLPALALPCPGDIGLCCSTPDLLHVHCEWSWDPAEPHSSHQLFYRPPPSGAGTREDAWQQCEEVSRGAQGTHACTFQPKAGSAISILVNVTRTHLLPPLSYFKEPFWLHQAVLTDAPQLVQATVSQGRLSLQWLPPLELLAEQLDYQVRYAMENSHDWKVLQVPRAARKEVLDLRPGSRYHAQVRAQPSGPWYQGSWSAWSKPVVVDAVADAGWLIPSVTVVPLLFSAVLLGLRCTFPSLYSNVKQKLWPPVPDLHRALGSFLQESSKHGQASAFDKQPPEEAVLPCLLEVLPGPRREAGPPTEHAGGRLSSTDIANQSYLLMSGWEPRAAPNAPTPP
ncbi:thrombopoietin receptor isoform X1 [Onychostruthus taczanowskii]|uniref:thrombopoietin receptor isoform X1 n=1 Tax=Onychostruthus taczanowskii TaxID=356909 RepID=UPI001B808BAF|nr:thrombopoietin receptor isoform X1 [Onychostruthus taczanowskii]